MAVVAALLDRRAALGALRRSLPPAGAGGGPAVLACRSPAGLRRAAASQLLEAMVVGLKGLRGGHVAPLRRDFPTVPVLVYGPFRSEDAGLVGDCQAMEVAVAVEGVDDPVVGDLVLRRSASARRRAALADLPRLLRLTDSLQRRAWDALISWPGRPPRTAALARRLGLSREHLSRQFGAGGAPNLKRLLDLLAVLTALDLLRNPGYDLAAVSRLLDFTSPSHLRAVVQRVMGLELTNARAATTRELVHRFVRTAARSRR